MSIPSTLTQLLATLLLVVPGFVYQAMRIRLLGRSPGDVDLAGRVLRSIMISTVFGLGYVVVMGPRATESLRDPTAVLDDPRQYAILGLAGAFLVPALVAVMMSMPTVVEALRAQNGLAAKVRAIVQVSAWTRYDPRPAAWDVAFASAEEGWFVRIKMADGTWYAGYWGKTSWASTFPDPHSIFVEAEYQVGANGVIGAEVQGTKGAVIQCADAVLVELLEPAPTAR